MPRPDAPIISWLGAIEGDVALVGGKAASLNALARLGFRIPPGFCVTTRAFDLQLASLPAAAAALTRLPDETARTELTSQFEHGRLEPGVGAALRDAVDQLIVELEAIGATPVRLAVRSSGIGEDSSAASFAGLHETELGVTPDGVAAAALRCWASLWSPAAVAYRSRRGIAADGGGMAVVVQALVPAECAAVIFTRHPVTGNADQLVITGVRGLGDAMVSGTVTPDTWVIDRGTGRTVEYTPGDRAHGQAGPALEEGPLADLATLAIRVEAGFGQPVDIEAAASTEGWYLLQARPITTA